MQKRPPPKAPPKLFKPTRVKHFRLKRKMTQAQLAEAADLSEGMISMLENGTRGYAQETMEVLAKVLRVRVSELLPEEDDEDQGVLLEQMGTILEKIQKSHIDK